MPGCREAAYVATDLGKNRPQGQGADAGNRDQQCRQGSKGGLSGLYFLIHPDNELEFVRRLPAHRLG